MPPSLLENRDWMNELGRSVVAARRLAEGARERIIEGDGAMLRSPCFAFVPASLVDRL
jgi:hypothetical protein